MAGRRALLPPLPRRPVTPLRHSRGDPARRIIVVEEACRAASPGRRGRGRLQGDEDDGSKFSIEIAKKVEFPMSRLPGNNYSSYLKQIQIKKMPDGSAVLLSSSLSQSWTECSRMHGCCKHECMIARGRGCGSPSGTHAACVSVTATLQEECGSAALDLELASRRDCSLRAGCYTDTGTAEVVGSRVATR